MGHTLFGALGLFYVPRPVLTVSPSWTSPGDSVTLTCSVEHPSAGWRFFWYKAVPDMSSYYTYYTHELLAGGTTGTEQGSYILHGQTHTAGYVCRAGRGDPVFYTQYSRLKFVWSGGVNPAASLTVSPHRLQHFSTESLSLICEGNSAEWRVMMADKYGYVSTCSKWGEMTGSTCNTDTRASSGVYWCESETQSSNAANITIHNVPRPVLTVSPSWTSPGDSVTLTCSVEPPSAGWRFFWYKAVPDMSSTDNYYNFELLAGGTNGTEQDSYILHGQTHTAGYKCRAGRGDPVFYTQYSGVKFVWSGGVNPAASLTVSPHRLQHFSTESLSLICEGNSTEWRVMKVDEDGDVSSCSYWGEMTGSTCNTNTRASSGVYWCESETQSSNAANITIHNVPQPVLTVSPSWTSPGDSVILTCSVEPPSAGWRFFWYKAVPDMSSTNNFYTFELLAGGTTGTEQDSYILHGQTHTAGYQCRAGRGDPVFYTQYSRVKFVWSGGVNPAASLTVSPHRLQHFSTESLSLICEGNSAEWRVMMVYEDGYVSSCSYWGEMTGSTCNTDTRASSGVYWCESGTQSSNAANITIHSVPRPVLTVSPSWTSPGDSVTLTCSVEPPSAGWRFFWYKAVPDLSDHYTYNTSELLAGGTTGTEQDSYIIHGQTHTAGYACRAGRGDPVSYTQYSRLKFVWSGGVNPAASLTVSPHRLQYFSTESLSLICEGNSAEWRVRTVDEDGDMSSCYNWGEMTGSTCNTTRASSGVYWCESETQSSNAANITIHNVPRPVLTVSPSWTSPGDSVTLTCSVEPPSAGWRFFWYKAVPDMSSTYNYYTYELLAGGTTGTEQDSYILHGHTHTAGYACRARRGDPVFYTQFSGVKFVLSGGVNPAASLTVSPHRLQHFSTESLSLICEGNSTEWRVKKDEEDGYVSRCYYWGEMNGSTCNTDTRASSGVYWCESETQSSNAANITIHSGDVILVSPVRPVTEGHSVTLGCKLRTENLLYNVDFYKNDKLIPNPARGELLISAVTKSDEGFYKCRGRKSPQGLETLTSAESWLSVKWTNDEPEERVHANMRMETAADG
uniref:Ig-like domain-containing protein n=1 Tax=Gasterosteus aculeatus aculeatus TaxID=481459 RepID=A0AAQ4RIV6_GASAC